MKRKSEDQIVKDIQRLYRTPRYSGIGGVSLQSKLALEKGWTIPLKTIYKALKGDVRNCIFVFNCQNFKHFLFSRHPRLCFKSQGQKSIELQVNKTLLE